MKFLFGLLLALMSSLRIAHADTIAISCGAIGMELELCRAGTEAWSRQTGHTIKLVSTPNSSTERLALYQQLLAAQASDIDIFQIDVVWPGMLANHFIDLKPYAGNRSDEHFPVIIQNNTVDGRLVGMPWFTDAGVLYYRKDLLDKYHAKVPDTWAQLTATAKKIQDAERAAGNTKMWGFVWQGSAYEGLTCNALEWIASRHGGSIIEPDGKISINNRHAIEAIKTAAGWIRTITPPGVLNYTEEEARALFQSGNAVFMRNWPYAWALINSDHSPIKGKVEVVALPKGGEKGTHAATLGGWQLAVSKYSKHPKLAADLVMYLTSATEQKRRAIEASFNPTIPSLYQDQEVLAANPFFGSLYDTFVHAVPRPSSTTGAQYNQVSTYFWNAVHAALSGRATPANSLKKLDRQLHRMRHR